MLVLYFVNGGVKSLIDSQPVGSIYVGRIVDDVLVCITSAEVVYLILSFNNELHSTSEKPVSGCFQFFGLILKVEGELCWKYCKPTRKTLVLPFSCHQGAVRHALAYGLTSSMQKRCMAHLVESAMQRQVTRLKSAGFSDRFISSVLENNFLKIENKLFWSKTRREKLSRDSFFSRLFSII